MKFLFYSKILWVLLLSAIAFSGCDTCGKDTELGDFSLEESSVNDWFPYTQNENLTFRNASGKEIILQLHIRELDKKPISFREICNEGFFDTAHEIYRADFFYAQYTTIDEGITYVLDNYLYVNHLSNTETFTLYDQVTFSSHVFRSKEETGVGGTVSQIAGYRGQEISDEHFDFLSWVKFAETIEIAGKIFQNVWYFERDGIPSLYVQKNKGVIAFAGWNGDIWILE